MAMRRKKISVKENCQAQRDNLDGAKNKSLKSSSLFSSPRHYLIGMAAALGVVGFYLGLITLTSDWYNAREL